MPIETEDSSFGTVRDSLSGAQWCILGQRPMASKGGEKHAVNDYTVKKCVLDAKRDGLPPATLKKWCTDLNRDFYVQDDASFIKAWGELRDKWEKNNSRKKRKEQQRQQREGQSQEPEAVRVCRGFPRTSLAKELPEVLASLQAARQDVQQGVCDSLERALAVHLSLLLGADAIMVLSALQGDGKLLPEALPSTQTALRALLAGAAGPPMAVKQLALLVHPDKTQHPRAKEAFQRLAPELRRVSESDACL
eukprot:s874_g11.t1